MDGRSQFRMKDYKKMTPRIKYTKADLLHLSKSPLCHEIPQCLLDPKYDELRIRDNRNTENRYNLRKKHDSQNSGDLRPDYINREYGYNRGDKRLSNHELPANNIPNTRYEYHKPHYGVDKMDSRYRAPKNYGHKPTYQHTKYEHEFDFDKNFYDLTNCRMVPAPPASRPFYGYRRNFHREDLAEPEWFTEGPSTHLDRIELQGFDDIESNKNHKKHTESKSPGNQYVSISGRKLVEYNDDTLGPSMEDIKDIVQLNDSEQQFEFGAPLDDKEEVEDEEIILPKKTSPLNAEPSPPKTDPGGRSRFQAFFQRSQPPATSVSTTLSQNSLTSLSKQDSCEATIVNPSNVSLNQQKVSREIFESKNLAAQRSFYDNSYNSNINNTSRNYNSSMPATANIQLNDKPVTFLKHDENIKNINTRSPTIQDLLRSVSSNTAPIAATTPLSRPQSNDDILLVDHLTPFEKLLLAVKKHEVSSEMPIQSGTQEILTEEDLLRDIENCQLDNSPYNKEKPTQIEASLPLGNIANASVNNNSSVSAYASLLAARQNVINHFYSTAVGYNDPSNNPNPAGVNLFTNQATSNLSALLPHPPLPPFLFPPPPLPHPLPQGGGIHPMGVASGAGALNQRMHMLAVAAAANSAVDNYIATVSSSTGRVGTVSFPVAPLPSLIATAGMNLNAPRHFVTANINMNSMNPLGIGQNFLGHHHPVQPYSLINGGLVNSSHINPYDTINEIKESDKSTDSTKTLMDKDSPFAPTAVYKHLISNNAKRNESGLDSKTIHSLVRNEDLLVNNLDSNLPANVIGNIAPHQQHLLSLLQQKHLAMFTYLHQQQTPQNVASTQTFNPKNNNINNNNVSINNNNDNNSTNENNFMAPNTDMISPQISGQQLTVLQNQFMALLNLLENANDRISPQHRAVLQNYFNQFQSAIIAAGLQKYFENIFSNSPSANSAAVNAQTSQRVKESMAQRP